MVHMTGHFALCDDPSYSQEKPTSSQTHNRESNNPSHENQLTSASSRVNLDQNSNSASLTSSSSCITTYQNEASDLLDNNGYMVVSSPGSTFSLTSGSGFTNDTMDNFKNDSTDDNDTVNQNANSCNGLRILFKGFVQVIKTNPMAELSLMDANLDEYVSRHTLDGTLLFADHRISIILGHTPDEVIGQSAYDYILPDDHSIALFAHRLSMCFS